MSIRVLIVWPFNSQAGRDSDRQRYSSLLNLLTVHSPEELAALDWNPAVVDCVAEKLTAINSFTMATLRWQLPVVPLNWRLAPSTCCRLPDLSQGLNPLTSVWHAPMTLIRNCGDPHAGHNYNELGGCIARPVEPCRYRCRQLPRRACGSMCNRVGPTLLRLHGRECQPCSWESA
jgi:hypothetical protein